MTELPEGWIWTTVGEVCAINPRHFDEPLGDDDVLSKVPMAAVEAGTGRMSGSETVRYGDVKKKSLTPFQEDDVLFAKVTPCMENGKIALAQGLYRGRAVGSTELFVLRSNGAILPSYLTHFLLQRPVREEAERSMTGAVGLRRVPRRFLQSLKIPLPPLAEQHRIITALESRLQHLDAGRNSLGRTDSSIKAWEVTILRRSTFEHDMASEWPSISIGEIATVTTGATPLRSRRDYHEGGNIPWVTSSLLNQPYIDATEQYITEKALLETSVKLFQPGTLLMAMYGEGQTRGRCAELRISATTNQACAAIQLHKTREFLRPWVKVNLEAMYQQNRQLATGGVQPNLNLGMIRNIRIPLPPENLQADILTKLQEQRHVATGVSIKTKRLGAQSVALRQEILRLAFVGRLTTQDPSDEPAEMLLERAKAHKLADSKATAQGVPTRDMA